MRAVWNDTTIAESNETIVVENNHYFPPESVQQEFLVQSDTHTTCPWKGEASYCDIAINGDINKDAAWFYPQPKEAAKEITGYFAFWNGVEMVE